VALSGGIDLGLPGSRGLVAFNNASTPATRFDIDADYLVLRSANGAVVAVNNPASITCNISTAGPAANGRDQSGAFTDPSWVHFYWIWNPGSGTLATIASATAPPTGPTLPTGYTHWAYVGAVRFTSAALLNMRILGDTAHYTNIANALALNNGSATTETSVSVSAIVPPNALAYGLSVNGSLTTGAGGSAAENYYLRPISGGFTHLPRVDTTAASQTATQSLWLEMPNISQQFFYQWANLNGAANVTTRNLVIYVPSYRVPNGG
jgi:hypothetical protein